PAAVADHPHRRARIQREAQVLAALNHPNIAQIHGVEESQSPVLVMELVDGQTLAEMIGRVPGPGIPLEDTLAIALQIAEALAFAHDCGIVHRDLKPANIKVRDDGIVKVLDFGLAKVFDTSPAAGQYAAAGVTFSPDSPGDATDSRTVTTPETRAGAILGTAAYMAPEQAMGRIIDRRADIWAFGVVFYEMLTSRRLFQGDTPSATMALVIERDVDLSALPVGTPQSIVTLLARCLTRNPRSRLQAMGEARLVIEEAIAARASGMRDVAAPAPRDVRAARTWWSLVAATALVAAAVAIWRPWQARTTAQLIRLSTELSAGVNAIIGLGASAVLSPDGTVVAFVGVKSRADGAGSIQLFVRRTDQLEAAALPGTERGRVPFFSPDGQW